MLDISTQAALNVGPVASPAAEYGEFLNESAPGAKDGTKLAARWFQDLYYAMYSVINATTGTVSDAVEDTDYTTGTQDFLAALQALGKLPSANPFMNYARFEARTASGVNGPSISGTTWTAHPLATEAVNEIGAVLGAGAVTLVEGNYRARFTGTAGSNTGSPSHCYHSARLRQTSGTATTVGLGSVEVPSESDGGEAAQQTSVGVCDFSVGPGGETFELQHWVSRAAILGRALFASAGEDNVFAVLEIWKLN